MSEEIRNRNNELSDAALESVSGRGSELVQEICASCLAKWNSAYSCTYGGGDPEELKRQLLLNKVIPQQPHTYSHCPYLKKL